MKGPPKKGAPKGVKLRGRTKQPNLQAVVAYRIICVCQRPFEFIFWWLEQRKARLADHLSNEGIEP